MHDWTFEKLKIQNPSAGSISFNKNMLSELLNLKCFKKVLAGRMPHEPTFKKLTDITIEISVVKVMLSVCRVFINKPCLQCMFFSILMKNYFILTGL